MASLSQAAHGLVGFRTAQQTFHIGGVQIGGQPGVRPAVLIGTIFYHEQRILIDEDRGEFQQDAAEQLIREQEDFAQRTGNPCMFDVVGATPEAMRMNLAFMARTTNAPLLIDGATTDVRLSGLECAAEAPELAGHTYQLHGQPIWWGTCSEKVLTLRSDYAAVVEAPPFSGLPAEANDLAVRAGLPPEFRDLLPQEKLRHAIPRQRTQDQRYERKSCSVFHGFARDRLPGLVKRNS